MVISNQRTRGFTYIGLLIVISLIGMSLAGAGSLWKVERKREKEQELIRVGHKFRYAIGQYYNKTPGVVKTYPPNLEALIHDDRFSLPQRYLRKIYTDPFTGMSNWGVVEAPSGGIMGVYSLSIEKPLKVSGFSEDDKHFENKQMYVQWVFAYLPMDYIAQ